MSHRLISGALQKHGMTRKRLEYVAKQRILAERARCRLTLQRMAEAGMMEDVIIIDEVHQADYDRQRRRGWSPRGTPAIVHEYLNTDGTSRSGLCACNVDGFIIGACAVVEGGVDDEKLMDWAQHSLAPKCQGKIVSLDNAIIHHQAGFKEFMEGLLVGATLLYLSPYSSDFSAIELGELFASACPHALLEVVLHDCC